MLLSDKVAVIYGAGGAIGGAVAHAFADEGAQVFGAGREVDALDEQAIDQHLQSVVDSAGRVDISFNAIGVPDATVVGVPLVDMDAERFSRPIADYTTSYFLTARLAARRMLAQGSGVIMTATALLARIGAPVIGGYGPAMAAKDALTRDLSAELAPHGIRVVGLRPQGMPETDTIKEAYERRAEASGMTWEEFQAFLASRTHPRRLMTLSEMAERRRVHGVRPSQRDDRHDREPDDGKPRRLSLNPPIPAVPRPRGRSPEPIGRDPSDPPRGCAADRL